MAAPEVTAWWKSAVIYQIYPASFKDSNGDGIGDIPGINSKLDYIKSIGVDAIWLSPFFASPQVDMGYDISDYQDVSPEYGTLADIEAFIQGCKERGMRVLFDLVINHSSDKHKWFLESSSSKDNPKSDYYIWRDPKYDENGNRKPPTNWKAIFGGSTWEWSETRQQYYFHLFCPEQPDLNWEEESIRDAIFKEAITFWLDKGIDGFRIDTVSLYSKFPYEDVVVADPEDPYQDARTKYNEGPRLHEFLKEMNAKAFAKQNAVSIGEFAQEGGYKAVLPYVSKAAKELDLVISFDLVLVDHKLGDCFVHDYKLQEFKRITEEWQALCRPEYEAWTCWYLENHDQARSVTRFASDAPQHRVASAKLLALYLLTLSGTLIIYQGQEIGMINLDPSVPIEAYIDVMAQNAYNELKDRNAPTSVLEQAKHGLQIIARDHARTPVQWDDSEYAGFSTKAPWMTTNRSYKEINVASQEKNPSSVLNFYRALLKIRREQQDVLTFGLFDQVNPDDPSTMIYTKTNENKVATVFLNFTAKNQPIDIPEGSKLVIGTVQGKEDGFLQAYEGRLYIRNN